MDIDIEGSRSLPLTLNFTSVGKMGATLGESPVYQSKCNAFWWVDCDGKKLHKTNSALKETTTWDTPEFLGFVVLSDANSVAVGMETGIFLFNERRGEFHKIAVSPLDNTRLNDAYVDPVGRLWAGTQNLKGCAGGGALYYIMPDFSFCLVADKLTYPNGLSVDAQNEVLYFSDSHPDSQTVWTVPWAPNEVVTLEKHTVFVDFSILEGRPDGATIDKNGNYWICAVGGGKIHVFNPSGTLLKSYSTPEKFPTKLAFGGDDYRQIFVTSKTDSGAEGVPVCAIIDDAGLNIGQAPNEWKISHLISQTTQDWLGT